MSEINFGDIYLLDQRYVINDTQDYIKPVIVAGIHEDREAGTVYRVIPLRNPGKRKGKDTFYISSRCGLKKDSVIDITENRYVKEERAFLKLIGRPDGEALKSLSAKLDQQSDVPRLGLVLRLCPRCLRDFMCDPDKIIRRLDSTQRIKERCSYCSTGLGYEYIVYNKKRK